MDTKKRLIKTDTYKYFQMHKFSEYQQPIADRRSEVTPRRVGNAGPIRVARQLREILLALPENQMLLAGIDCSGTQTHASGGRDRNQYYRT